MWFRRGGKCSGCDAPCTAKKWIEVKVDMFDPKPKTYLKGAVLQQLRAWRKLPLFCGGDACKASSSELQLGHNHSNERSE